MLQITKHFSLKELTVTATGFENFPNAQEHFRALYVTAYGLENIRRLLGNKPLFVTSAYRSPFVNRAVGGVNNSDHALGYAADFYVKHMTVKQAAEIIRDSQLVFDQLIIERDDTIIHISFHPRARREILRQKGKAGTPVTRGLD